VTEDQLHAVIREWFQSKNRPEHNNVVNMDCMGIADIDDADLNADISTYRYAYLSGAFDLRKLTRHLWEALQRGGITG
jgi:hypothetical protein